MNNKNVTLLRSASLVGSPERDAVTGASPSSVRSSDNYNNDTKKEVVEAVSR
jgi:hypothetical protein